MFNTWKSVKLACLLSLLYRRICGSIWMNVKVIHLHLMPLLKLSSLSGCYRKHGNNYIASVQGLVLTITFGSILWEQYAHIVCLLCPIVPFMFLVPVTLLQNCAKGQYWKFCKDPFVQMFIAVKAAPVSKVYFPI